MKQEIDNNAMWTAFRQELALQGELQVVAAIDNALNNLGFTIEETSTIVSIPLKRWEQKPTDKVEPKFKIGDIMRTLQEAKDGWTDGMPVVVSIDEEYYHCTNELIAIKDQDEYEYPPMNRKHDICDSCYEQKPAWNDKDNKMVKTCLSYLSPVCCSPEYKEFENWFNSLKDKVLTQPQHEWSEDYISKSLEKCRDSYGHLDKLRIIDWLKSLRPQNRWKPSDEQMKALSTINITGDISYAGQGQELIDLYKNLKKLKG